MRYKIASLAAAAIAFGATQPASAADMAVKAPMAPVAAAYSWDGCYVGANAGYVRSTSSTQLTGTDTDGGGFGSELADGSTPSSFDTRFNGVIGGGQVGCNRTGGGFVWGGDVDADWSGMLKGIISLQPNNPAVLLLGRMKSTEPVALAGSFDQGRLFLQSNIPMAPFTDLAAAIRPLIMMRRQQRMQRPPAPPDKKDETF